VPAFSAPVYVGAPTDAGVEEFVARAREIFDRRLFTNDGPYVHEFERAICERFGVANCVAVSNGTAAIELTLRATEAQGEVILPSFTFIATAHAVLWQGLTPVFCDVDPKTHNISAAQVEPLIAERTTAILGVHLWGRPAYSDELEQLAKHYGLRLLFDASHAFGCTHARAPVGGRGDAETLSFHATKIVNTFEGGAVVTNDDHLAHRLRLLRNFGFVDYDDVRTLGTNAKLNEISAAMGLTSLDWLDHAIDHNRRNYETYRAELAGTPCVSLVEYDECEAHNYQYVVVELDPAESAMSRDDLLSILHAENVIARRYFYPGCHRMEPYRSLRPQLQLPVTEALADRVVVLPTGLGLDEAGIRLVCALIKLALEGAEALPRPLPSFRRIPRAGD
jgi:dTDP-4-amino-4,6-dideoxygalactose transaminase